jgi:GrpB-like predicted nucleotidyltransferase (UPF0157 family)
MNKKLDAMSNRELWELFPIILSKHETCWVTRYEKEKIKLERAVGIDYIVRINHIGSTAVPGIMAKPTIDILLEITEKTDIEKLIECIQSAGYICSKKPENPAPHMMFMKGYTPHGFKGQVFHLHIRYSGDWDEIHFRDYLLKHPEAAKQYEQLKLELKNKFEHDRDSYTEGKTEFIKLINKLARG